ncbi:MAG: YeeE/YedE family protein [Ignavibacteria bacterium]|nr:YeeE/YedE family protein [Ignavibacteria bacterium]
MLPIDVIAVLGKFGGYAVFVLIGIGFGVSLELAGFGDSRRLAAQFYLKDMTVLKTMFTAIIVAAILIFLSAAIGILDFSQISVTQTFLWPGIVGGLIMGVGFIVGGYCPGTSLVSVASLKIDGLFFLIGTVLGAGFFGESLPAFEDFWNSSFTERYLLSDWLGWSIGATLFAVTLMALVMFYGAEKTEEFFRTKGKDLSWSWKITKRSYVYGAAALVVSASLVWFIGQPDPVRKWSLMENKYSGQLASRDVFIHPLEYVKTYNDASIKLVTLDLRSDSEFKTFHLSGSENTKPEDILVPKFIAPLVQLPAQGVVVLIADNDSVSTLAWKYLKVQGVSNVYILENGLHDWNTLFGGKTVSGKTFNLDSPPAEVLQLFPKDAFTPKIKISTKKRSGGLCS